MLKWILGPLAMALALAPAATAAAPAASPPALSAALGSDVHLVQYRHSHRGRHHHRFGTGVGLGLGIGVLGAIIAHEAYGPRPGYYVDDYADDGPYGGVAEPAGDPRNLCAQHFRSFEWNTGLYTTHSGEKRLCPYLR
jgi:BA14K-like protein